MTIEYANQYDSLTSTDFSGIDVQVNNGMLVDGNGNPVYFGRKQSGIAYRGYPDHYVDRVDGATPTGNLSIVNNEPYIDGYGAVNLTDVTGDRKLDTTGGSDNNDGNIRINSNGELECYYTDEYWTDKANGPWTFDTSEFPISKTVTGFNSDDKNMHKLVMQYSISNHDDTTDASLDVHYDTNGDGNYDTSRTIQFDNSPSTYDDYTGGFSGDQHSVKVDNWQFNGGAGSFYRAECKVDYEEYIVDEYDPEILIY